MIAIILVIFAPLAFPANSFAGEVGPDAFGYIADGSATFSFQDMATTGIDVEEGDLTLANLTLAINECPPRINWQLP